MSTWKRIQDVIDKRKKKKIERSVEEMENVYKDTETREEGIKETARKAIEQINLHPELAVKFLESIQESEKLPTEIVVEAIKQIPETEQIEDPEGTILEAVEKLPLASSQITDIIKETNVSIPAAKEMTNQIPNEKIREEEKSRLEEIERIKRKQEKQEKEKETIKSLKEKYVNCDKIPGERLASELEEIKKKNNTPKIDEIIIQILARKAAIEWRFVGNTRLPSMYKIVSPEEMMEIDFPKLVGEEFEEIKHVKKYKGENDYSYSEENLRKLILKEISKHVASIYEEIGTIEIPQSKAMNNLNQTEEQYFIGQIQKNSSNITNIDMIKNKIRGINNYELEDLVDMLKKLPDNERAECLKIFKKKIIEIRQRDKENSKNEDERKFKNNENGEEEYTH